MTNKLTKPLLILDLDETLLHTHVEIGESFEGSRLITNIQRESLPNNTPGAKKEWDGLQYHFFPRPYLKEFLTNIINFFHLAVFTASTEKYAKFCIESFFPETIIQRLLFVWSREKTTYHLKFESDGFKRIQIKKLDKVKKFLNLGNLNRVLILDDRPDVAIKNYGNLVPVKPYFGEVHDQELLLVMEYLISISSEKNFRKFEKRHWNKLSG